MCSAGHLWWRADSQLGNRKCWVCGSTVSGICVISVNIPLVRGQMSHVETLFCNVLLCWRAWSFLPLGPVFCISAFPLISELVADPILVWIKKLSCFRRKMIFELLACIFLIELITVCVVVMLGLVWSKLDFIYRKNRTNYKKNVSVCLEKKPLKIIWKKPGCMPRLERTLRCQHLT